MDRLPVGDVGFFGVVWANWEGELPWILIAILGLYAALHGLDRLLRPGKPAPRPRPAEESDPGTGLRPEEP